MAKPLVLSTEYVHVPPAPEGRSVSDGIREWRPRPPEVDSEHGRFWPVIRDQKGRPVHPKVAERAIRKEGAAFADHGRANRDVTEFGRQINSAIKPAVAYEFSKAVDADAKRIRRQRRHRLYVALELEVGDDIVPGEVPPTLTLSEVADVLRVSEDTVRRQVEKRTIPGAVRIGAQLRFRTRSIAGYLAP